MQAQLLATFGVNDNNSAWGIISKKDLETTVATQLNGLFYVAAVGDLIYLTATDGFAILEITEIANESIKTKTIEKRITNGR